MLEQYNVLGRYGLRDDLLHALPPGTEPARVIRHDGRSLLAVTTEGPRALLLPARLDPTPTVGDWVAIRGTDIVAAPGDDSAGNHPERSALVADVLPRRSLLRRLSADQHSEQALAANVDLVLITCGLDRPVSAGRIQRVAVQAWDAGATPVLLLTKAALPDTPPIDLPRLELEHPGLAVLVSSAQEGQGIEDVRALLTGRTAVLVGESGSGKSTLTNALLAAEVVATGRVRTGDAKGRHTTTSRQLHLLPGPDGGCLIDIPGVRSMGLAADADSVDSVFPEIAELAAECRFSDCAHRSEPGCAVLAAVDAGDLAEERFAAWQRLQREIASAARRASPRGQRAHERTFAAMVRSAVPRGSR